MHIPHNLRIAIDEALDGQSTSALHRDFTVLSRAYAQGRSETPFVDCQEKVFAYIAARMPSIYVVLRAVFNEIAARCPTFAPTTLIDAGSGPGTVLWAAAEIWQSLTSLRLLDNNPLFREIGRQLASSAHHPLHQMASWEDLNLLDASQQIKGSADLVTASYVLGELSPSAQERRVLELWRSTEHFLVIVEPGTPDGFRRVMKARSLLLDAGAALFAPCAGPNPCPLPSERWCHFARRVERTRAQRSGKAGTLGFEDEKYCFLIVSPKTTPSSFGRVVATSTILKHQATLHLCDRDNQLVNITVTKRESRNRFRAVTKELRWGDYVAEFEE